MCQSLADSKQNLKVYVFSTSIQTQLEKRLLDGVFAKQNGIFKWSLDLTDWQHVLRVETVLSKKEIKDFLRRIGIQYAELN